MDGGVPRPPPARPLSLRSALALCLGLAAAVPLAFVGSLLGTFGAFLLPFALRHEPWSVTAALVALGVAAGCLAALLALGYAFRRARRLPLLAAAAACGAAVTVTMLTAVALPRTVLSEAHQREVWFGYPVAFVEAELFASPPSYPRTMRWNPWEDPSDVHGGRFLASYVLVLGALLGPPLVVRRLRRRAA